MVKPKPVDEIFGIPIYFNPIREKFYAKLNDKEYKADRLSDLKRDLAVDKPIELEESVIYCDSVGEMVLTTIVEISPHGWLTPRERVGIGVPANPEYKNIFPRSTKNMAIFKSHKAMRERGGC